MAKLIVLQGPDKGRSLETDEDSLLIGRDREQASLTDQSVSRRHATLRRVNGCWELCDLHSANGTYINGVRVQKPTRLKRGDQIRLGSTLLVYTGEETIEQYSGPSIPHDLVTLDAGSLGTEASIMASVPASEDSVVLAAPETAYAVKGWNVMRQLTDVIASFLPPDELLARVMDVIFDQVQVDHGVILMRRSHDGELHPEVVRFRQQRELADGTSITASRTIIHHVLHTREGVLCSNAVSDQRFGRGKSVQNLGMRSVICCPIVAHDEIIGVIHLDCAVTRHTYNEHDLKLIAAIGCQAGLAIENARLVQNHLRQERLAAAGEAVAYLSHHIKNILQGMRGGADVLQRGLDRRDFSLTAQGWAIVERNLDRSYHLMMNMLAFSKPREPRFEMLQVNKIVEDVVSMMQKQADAVRVVLLADLDEHLPPIPVDYEGVHRVLLNLAINAVDAVERGRGIVSVRTEFDADQRQVVLSVQDNGPGITPENRTRVFEAFYSSKGQGGTGLGLAVARKVTLEMKGAIELRDPPDGGAEFRVILPASQPGVPSADDTTGPLE
ncbi:MAG: ATP-binding protein [Phycisphaerae bacterium]